MIKGVEWIMSVKGIWHLSSFCCKGRNEHIKILAVKVATRSPLPACKRCRMLYHKRQDANYSG